MVAMRLVSLFEFFVAVAGHPCWKGGYDPVGSVRWSQGYNYQRCCNAEHGHCFDESFTFEYCCDFKYASAEAEGVEGFHAPRFLPYKLPSLTDAMASLTVSLNSSLHFRVSQIRPNVALTNDHYSMARWIADGAFGKMSRASLVDLRSCVGFVALAAAALGFDVLATDDSQGTVDCARNNTGLNRDVLRGNVMLRRLTWGAQLPQRFDLAVCAGCLDIIAEAPLLRALLLRTLRSACVQILLIGGWVSKYSEAHAAAAVGSLGETELSLTPGEVERLSYAPAGTQLMLFKVRLSDVHDASCASESGEPAEERPARFFPGAPMTIESMDCSARFKRDFLPFLLQWRVSCLHRRPWETSQRSCGASPGDPFRKKCEPGIAAARARGSYFDDLGNPLECPQGTALLALFCLELSRRKRLNTTTFLWGVVARKAATSWRARGLSLFHHQMILRPPALYTDVGLTVAEVMYNLERNSAGPWVAWPPPASEARFPEDSGDPGRAYRDLERLIPKYRLPAAGYGCIGADQHCQAGGHCYTPSYAAHVAPLRSSISDVLLLGLCRGASLAAFTEFFPAARMYGVDVNLSKIDFELLADLGLPRSALPRIQVFEADCKTQLPASIPQVDLVIDDADHAQDTVSRGFENIFLRLLRPGGLYVIEDIPDHRMDHLLEYLQTGLLSTEPWANHRPGGSVLINNRLAALHEPHLAWVKSVQVSSRMIVVQKRYAVESIYGRTLRHWLELDQDRKSALKIAWDRHP